MVDPDPSPLPPPDQADAGSRPLLPRHTLPTPYDDGPDHSQRRGLPTWMWVIISLVIIFIGLPLLALGALFLYCAVFAR